MFWVAWGVRPEARASLRAVPCVTTSGGTRGAQSSRDLVCLCMSLCYTLWGLFQPQGNQETSRSTTNCWAYVLTHAEAKPIGSMHQCVSKVEKPQLSPSAPTAEPQSILDALNDMGLWWVRPMSERCECQMASLEYSR